MRYPHALSGVKKIFTSEILSIIAEFTMLIALVLVAIAGAGGLSFSGGSVMAAAALALILAGGVLIIVAVIFGIIGCKTASKDEAMFGNAMIAMIIRAAAVVLSMIFSGNQTVKSLCDTVETVMEFLACYFICSSIITLADLMGDGAVSMRGKRVRTLLTILWLGAVVMNVLPSIFGSNTGMMTVLAVAAIAGSVVSILANIMYIILLGKAKKMLER